MSDLIKTAEEIEKMRSAGRDAAAILTMIEPHIKEGVTTDEINDICHDFMVNIQHVIPAPLNYRGFPKSICTSINHVVCHGIPGEKKLKQGDIMNIDITIIKDDFHSDTSKMYMVGKPSILAQRLVRVTQEALYLSINAVKEGAYIGDIGALIEQHAKKNRFSVVREFCGHGIGRIFHDEPQVPHYGKKNTGMRLEAGMTLTIEPMLNAGKRDIKILPDGWTAVTKDHSLSAQWEHTLLVTKTGAEILTLRDDDTIPRII